MKKTVKCSICKKEIIKDDAYSWIHVSKTNKEYKKYCCSLEEKELYERDLELYKQVQYLTDSILGRPITNNARNKELKELHDAGHSWETIYRCIKSKADDIKQMIEFNHIENDYQQIRYMMQVIKNVIYDFAKEDEEKNSWVQHEDVVEYADENVDTFTEETDEDILKRLKNNKPKSGGIADILNKFK